MVIIGSFDGVHLGHLAILKQVKEQAAKLRLPSVVIVFEPQPTEFFSGAAAPARLMCFREKAQALFAAGIDRVFCLYFNESPCSKLQGISELNFIFNCQNFLILPEV